MKNVRRFSLGLALGLGLALSSVGFAQNITQTPQPNKTESCCAMDSCCKGESCPMKDHAKKEHTKSQSDKDGCCCSGNSCNMKTQDSMKKNHTAKDGCGCCAGDSCSMNHEMKEHAQKDHAQKDNAKMIQGRNAAAHGDHDGCCCCSDSCDMKMKHDMQEKAKG